MSLKSFNADCMYIIRIQEKNEPRHEILNNMVGATSKASDQSAHTRSLILAFASHLNILGVSKLKKRLHRLA